MGGNKHFQFVCLPESEELKKKLNIIRYNTNLGRKVKATQATSANSAISKAISRYYPEKVGIIEEFLRANHGDLSRYVMDADAEMKSLVERNPGIDDTGTFYGLVQTMNSQFIIRREVCSENISDFMYYRGNNPLTNNLLTPQP